MDFRAARCAPITECELVAARSYAALSLGYRALFIVVVVLSMFVMAPVMVPVVVRVVVVLNTAAISFPVTCVVPFAVVVWSNPASPLVGWASPIAFMPLEMIYDRPPTNGR
jgi:hypothetical protein